MRTLDDRGTARAPVVGEVVLDASGISRSFGATRAVRSVGITLRAGEIHGLIGENGSGKSTTLNILSGQLDRDGGAIADGAGRHLSQRDLRSTVAIVTQELSLAGDLSVGENILMAHSKPRTWRGIDWRELHRRAATALERVGLDIDPRTPVRKLRIDQQQLVEVAKAAELDNPVLILDEPTSSLTEDESAVLFRVMRDLRDRGSALVIVSHRLDELLDLTDRITVLRDGIAVSSRPTIEYTEATLVRDMLGHEVESYQNDTVAVRAADCALRVTGVSVPGEVHGVDLEVGAGEIVGLVGLEGSGRSALLRALFGAQPGAIGDAAIDLVAAGLERALERCGPAAVRSARHRIEHLTMVSPAHRAKRSPAGSRWYRVTGRTMGCIWTCRSSPTSPSRRRAGVAACACVIGEARRLPQSARPRSCGSRADPSIERYAT